MRMKELIKKILNNEYVDEDIKKDVYIYLRHIPNYYKTEEEWELYCRHTKEKGLPEPDRNSRMRPLHEKRV